MDNVFKALADPTRRQIIELLAGHQNGKSITELSDDFKVSRQAVTKHLVKLKESGLIDIKKSGREQICKAELKKLRPALVWIDKYYNFWNENLDALGDYLDDN